MADPSRCIAVIALMASGACADPAANEDWRDRNRPATYGDGCDAQADCASPFQCLEKPDGGLVSPLCSQHCTVAADCPTWTATGHCAGPRQSTCVGGVCDYPRCR